MFVLIVTTWVGYGFTWRPVISMQEFTTEERCLSAKNVILLTGRETEAKCVPK